MAAPQINSSSKSGTPLPCGNGKERLTVVLFAETILWTFALNAKPLKKMNKTKNAMSLGEHAIMLSISIASQDGLRQDRYAHLIIDHGNSKSMENDIYTQQKLCSKK